MDRLVRILAGGSLAAVVGLVVCASGCRSMRSEVPQGKPYPTNGGSPPTVGFGSDPRPNPAANAGQWSQGTSMTPGTSVPDGGNALNLGSGAQTPQFGTPTPNSANYGAPSGWRYGPPTTTTPGTPNP
jgi:hypothetical protein